MLSKEEDGVFLTQIKVRRRNNHAIMRIDAVLNLLTDLESERAINVWRNISLNSSDHTENKNKCNDMRCPRMCSWCKQYSNYIWKYLIQIDLILYSVLCLEIYLYFSFLKTNNLRKQSHIFKSFVSTVAIVYTVLLIITISWEAS